MYISLSLHIYIYIYMYMYIHMGGCRRSAAISPNELEWENVDKMWQRVATYDEIWQHVRT